MCPDDCGHATHPLGQRKDWQKSVIGATKTPDEEGERPVPPPVLPARPGTPRPLPVPRGRLDLTLEKIPPEWRARDSREIEPPRTDVPFINIIPLDNWQEIALLAGPYGALALWVMCSRSRRGTGERTGQNAQSPRGHCSPDEGGVL